MRKILMIVGGILLAIVLAAVLFHRPTTFENADPDRQENFVRNLTEKEYMETLVLMGLESLQIPDVVVVVRYIENLPQNAPGDMYGYIEGGRYNQFVIFLNERNNVGENINTISHELVHLKQTYDGRLVKTGTTVVFDGITYINANNIEYRERPWEAEAFAQGEKLKNQIYSRL